jgi:hypothetical protein
MFIDRVLALAAFAACGLVVSAALAQSPGNFSTLSTTGTATLGGTVLACGGQPWIDVRCNGATGDDTHDDTSAIQVTITTAITNNWPVHIPAGTYKVTSGLVIDYAGQAGNGFRLVSEGATLDGTGIASGPVLQVECSGGTTGSPTGCFYFKEEGALFVRANASGYAVVIGKSDFSDAHNSIKIDHLVVNNANTSSAAGGLQLNYVLDSDIYAVADSAGGAAGIALEQTQFSRISGAGSAAGTGGAAMLLGNGYDFSNTVFGFDFEVAPTCLSITTSHDGQNSFVSPYFNCATAVNATASTRNLLINPTYAGAVTNRGPQSTGVQVVGTGSWAVWQFPSTTSYTASGIDDGTAISSYNAPGASLAVTLPAPNAVNAGWRMGFATDNGKGMTVTAPSGSIVSGGKALSSVTLGPGNYEYLELQSDGNNFRVVTGTRNTLATNGLQSRDWPGNWLYPSTSGYAAQLGDNGNVVSSFNSSAGLTVTLPPTTGLPSGWSMGFATDQGKSLKVQVNGTSGGHILYPLVNTSGQSSLTLAGNQYEYVTLQYDGSGDFRVEQMTPATAQQLGVAGIGGISRWSFPSGSAYAATVADNGNAIADAHDITRLAIETRKDQLERLDWAIRVIGDKPRQPHAAGRVQAVAEFWRRPDGERPFATWLRELMEDLLVLDAPVLELRRNRGGALIGLDIVDGATIKVLADETGRRPRPPAPAYEQVIKGRPWKLLTSDELLYWPHNPRPHKAYGFSPVEQIVMTVNIALRRQVMQLQHFTDGNVPPGLLNAPDGWNVEQISLFQEWFDSVLAGNTGSRTRLVWGPSGSKYQAFKEAPYKDDFDEWLARIVCYAFRCRRPPSPSR